MLWSSAPSFASKGKLVLKNQLRLSGVVNFFILVESKFCCLLRFMAGKEAV